MTKTIPCPRCKSPIGEGHATVGMHPDFMYVCEDCDESVTDPDEYMYEEDDPED